MYLRIRQVALLTVPVTRTVPWSPTATAVALSLLACLPAVAGAAAPASQVWALRIAAFLLGAGASFALIEPFAPVAATPTPRWLRQWLRTVVALTPVIAVWPVLFSLAACSLPADGLPFADLAAEASVCGLTGVAGAAVAARRANSLTGALAGPAARAPSSLHRCSCPETTRPGSYQRQPAGGDPTPVDCRSADIRLPDR